MDRGTSIDRAITLIKRLHRIHSLAKDCTAKLSMELQRLPEIARLNTAANLLGSELEDPRELYARPIVDTTAMTVTWRGERCPLGHTRLLDLVDRIVRSPNRWYTYDRLKQEVWGRERISDEAIKVAITRLRQRLKQHGMENLAATILIRGHRCGYFPNGLHE